MCHQRQGKTYIRQMHIFASDIRIFSVTRTLNLVPVYSEGARKVIRLHVKWINLKWDSNVSDFKCKHILGCIFWLSALFVPAVT